MNLSPKALWIVGGISVVVIVCCIALAIALHSGGKIEDRQQADIKALSTVRDADNNAQIINNSAKKKADEDAQKKASILNGISTDFDDSDFVRGMQRGLRGEGADSGAGSAGKSSGTVPATNHAAGTDANVKH